MKFEVLMKFLFISFLQLIIISAVAQNGVYKIIIKSNSIPGDINYKAIKKLSEPMKAMASFYSAMGGSYCTDSTCELTSALGLGRQGSDKQVDLIKKYFPNDKVAVLVVKQKCYLRPSGASRFSEYNYLTFSVSADTVKVYYTLTYYNREDFTLTKGPDIYIFEKDHFKKLKRKLWAWVEEKKNIR